MEVSSVVFFLCCVNIFQDTYLKNIPVHEYVYLVYGKEVMTQIEVVEEGVQKRSRNKMRRRKKKLLGRYLVAGI